MDYKDYDDFLVSSWDSYNDIADPDQQVKNPWK